MSDNGRLELARRLRRIFLSRRGPNDSALEIPETTLLDFADDILAGDYTDPRHGPRPGDGGPPMRLREDPK